MNASDKSVYNLIVTGDVVVDHHIYEGERFWPAMERARGVKACRELGGADLVRRLLVAVYDAEKSAKEAKKKAEIAAKKAAADGKPAEAQQSARKALEEKSEPVWQVQLGLEAPAIDKCPDECHALAVWKPHPDSKEKEKKGSKERIWRTDQALGYGETCAAGAHKLESAANLPPPDILVLDEAGFRFRKKENASCWRLPAKGEPQPDWIVLKMARPVAQGDLWHELTGRFAKKLVCVISADDLRQECVSVSQGLSWERSIDEGRRVVLEDPTLKSLSKCRHLVVRFKGDGALWINRQDEAKPEVTLVFDAGGAEGMWDDHFEGKVIGYSSAMTVAVTRALAESVASKTVPDLAQAIARGLAAGRNLLEKGHGEVGKEIPRGFPADGLAKVLIEPAKSFSFLTGPLPTEGETLKPLPEGWSIVETSQRPYGSAAPSALKGLAHQIVLKGDAAYKGLPHAKFGKMTSLDRVEIETLRAIRRLMLAYKNDRKAKKPLSIGVFGPPGAGKSFGVKQLSNEVYEERAWLEFNLSQFAGPEDLIGAFHQVRDKVLEGITPVVFWDEFDSQKFRWLQYLLAPMQDGHFQEGQITHAIGKCVFVFAGGTSHTYKDFLEHPDDTKEQKDDFRLSKGPDFHSRLDAFYDVLGPNQRRLAREKLLPKDVGQPPRDPSDVCYPLRRALLIRAQLGCKGDEHLDFDSDLVDALLMVSDYKHGARSLEKFVSQLKTSLDQPIRRSSLPAAAQLAMHVDADKFASILGHNTGFRMSKIIEDLAKKMHNRWLDGLSEKEKKEKRKKSPHLLRPYEELDEIDKEDNRAAARRVPDVLALVGVGIAPVKPGMKVKTDPKIKTHLKFHRERLAEAEHDGWMRQREKNGWQHGLVRDDDLKIYNLLVPYGQLPEHEKNKDRDTVTGYAQQLPKVGYRLIWL